MAWLVSNSGRTHLLSDFSFEKIDNDETTGVNQGNLTIKMMDRGGDCIRLKFSGVRNLQIRTGPYIDISIVGLAIQDMSNDQWPGVQLRVASEDNGTGLSFYCFDAEIVK